MLAKLKFAMFMNQLTWKFKKPITLHATIFKREKYYVARCHETEMNAFGQDYEDAVKKLKAKVSYYIKKVKPGMRYKFNY